MKFKILKNQKWMFWAAGMVLYPFVIYRVAEPWPRLFKHELKHCYQVKEMGVAKFYTMYVLLLLRYGYRNHPYEKEAQQYEKDPLTAIEQQWFDNQEDGINLDDQWLKP